jgi:acetyl esterase/lipase
MKTLFTVILVLSYLIQGFSQCQPQRYIDPIFSTVNRIEDVTYASADPYGLLNNQDLLFDFYEPLGDTLAKRPLIIYMYGGAFLIGDKRQPPIPEYCEYFAKRGYVVAAIQYRIGFNTLDGNSAMRAVFRAVQDFRAACRYFAHFQQTYRIDLDNIFATGSSAGCVTALHSVYMQESERPAATYGILLEPQDLGCGNCSGNNYYNNQYVPVKAVVNNWGAIGDLAWMNLPDSVPVLSIHGTNDGIVPYNVGQPFSLPIWPNLTGSNMIHPHLQSLGIYSELVPLWGAGHEPELLNPDYLDTMYLATVPFLYKNIQPKISAINGPNPVYTNQLRTYSVAANWGSDYCWTIQGGTIINDNGASVDVIWNSAGQHSIEVTERNYIKAVSLPFSRIITVYNNPNTGLTSSDLSQISLQPNPSNGPLYLSVPSGQTLDELRVELFDSRGALLWSSQLHVSASSRLDIPNLPQGSYWLRLSHQQQSTVKSFVRF